MGDPKRLMVGYEMVGTDIGALMEKSMGLVGEG